MPNEKPGVNTVVPESPAAPEPEKPVVAAPEAPVAGDVTPETPQTPEAPVAAPETPDDKNPMIPRGRLNEEIAKRHELEERLKALEDARTAPPAVPQAPVTPQRDEIDSLAEQMSAEAGKDEFGNDILPVKAAKVVVLNQLKFTHAATAGTRLERNVAEYVKQNPVAAPYADKIIAGLTKLEPGVKDNPANVVRMFKEIRADDIDKLVLEAEERGRKKALEQKKIVAQAAGETPSGLPDGKTAGDMLSVAEKQFADNHKISYDDYYKAKGNKRV